LALHDTYDYEEDDDDIERENDDRKEEDDKDRKLDNGQSELIAIPTRTLFNSCSTTLLQLTSPNTETETQFKRNLENRRRWSCPSRGKGTNILR
jgi:hypothetical protein